MKLFNRTPTYCAICEKELKRKNKPKKEWNIEGYLCSDCHMDKTRQYYDVVIPTGMGHTRDFLTALSADGVIVIGGGSGVLPASSWPITKI